jgi:hypothetical protein
MPYIGSNVLSLCSAAITPHYPQRQFQVLDRPGMSDQSTLFHAAKWKPLEVVMLHGVADNTAADALIAAIVALIRSKVILGDGLRDYTNVLILQVAGFRREAGMVLGPFIAAGAVIEVEIRAIVLPDSP